MSPFPSESTAGLPLTASRVACPSVFPTIGIFHLVSNPRLGCIHGWAPHQFRCTPGMCKNCGGPLCLPLAMQTTQSTLETKDYRGAEKSQFKIYVSWVVCLQILFFEEAAIENQSLVCINQQETLEERHRCRTLSLSNSSANCGSRPQQVQSIA